MVYTMPHSCLSNLTKEYESNEATTRVTGRKRLQWNQVQIWDNMQNGTGQIICPAAMAETIASSLHVYIETLMHTRVHIETFMTL